MTHFSVIVLLPRLSASEQNEEIDRLLAPYSEHLEVDEYDKPCYCVGRVAKKHGRDMADKLVGSWKAKKDDFWDMPEIKASHKRKVAAMRAEPYDEAAYTAEEAYQDQQWETFTAAFRQQWEETERDYTEHHPAYGQPNADCDTCNGTGTYRSTYNPQSQWDWYRVGGRFDGLITRNPQSSENGFNFDAKHETLANNSVPVTELLEAQGNDLFTTWAIVTPEGEWIEKGKMGWWAISWDVKQDDAWKAISRGVYEKYSAFDAVLLDCHI